MKSVNRDKAGKQDPKHSDHPWVAGYWLKNVKLVVMGGATIGLLLGLVAVWQVSDRFLGIVGSFFKPTQSAPKVDIQSVIVQQMRDARELTTAVFTMQAVVPASQDATLGGWVVGTTKLLYIAQGEVRVGVDLGQLKPDNVQVAGDQVRVLLPPPRILDSKIDVNRSRVYDYNRGVLNLGPDVAPQLQTLAQQQALKTIVTTACTNGVLEDANSRAKLVVTQLLTTAGHKAVTVDTQPGSAQECPTAPVKSLQP